MPHRTVVCAKKESKNYQLNNNTWIPFDSAAFPSIKFNFVKCVITEWIDWNEKRGVQSVCELYLIRKTKRIPLSYLNLVGIEFILRQGIEGTEV